MRHALCTFSFDKEPNIYNPHTDSSKILRRMHISTTLVATAVATLFRLQSALASCSFEGRKEVAIGNLCCGEIARIQNSPPLSIIPSPPTSTNTSQHENVCNKSDNFIIPTCDFETGATDCVYDRAHDAPACAKEAELKCVHNRGLLVLANYSLECGKHHNFTFEILDMETCLGLSCTRFDIQEFLWESVWLGGFLILEELNQNGFDCKVVAINGQSENAKEEEDAINALIGAVLIFGFGAGYVYLRFGRPTRVRRTPQRVTRVPVVEMPAVRSTTAEFA